VLTFLDSARFVRLEGGNPMRINRLVCFTVAFAFVLCGAAMAIDIVDIGNPASEAGHAMSSWGPIEPGTHPGNWGGIGSWGGTCRVIWSPNDTPVPGSRDAFIDLMFSGGSELLSFMHLDGLADDSFEVWLGPNLIWTYNDPGLPGEIWSTPGFIFTFPAGLQTIRLEAIGNQWSGWPTYGQCAFAGISVLNPVSVEEGTWGSVKALFR